MSVSLRYSTKLVLLNIYVNCVNSPYELIRDLRELPLRPHSWFAWTPLTTSFVICVNSSHDSVRLLREFPSRFSSFIVRTQHTNYLLLAGENSMRGFLKSYHTAGIIIYIRLKGRPSRRDVSRGLSRTFKNPNQIFFKIQNRILST